MSDKKLKWTAYFSQEEQSFFHNLLSLHRRLFISRAVKYYFDRFLPQEGIFLEAGAGTSQGSSRIRQPKRKLVALDNNYYVLKNHNILPCKIGGDILSLPFKSGILDGLWNLGVMEHLTDEKIILALNEFKRVIKKSGVILLFWPPYYALHEMILNSISWLFKKVLNKETEFFPDEINLYRDKDRLLSFLNKVGLKLVRLEFSIRDLFSYKVMVVKK